MSFSYIKRKLSVPETVQLGKTNQISQNILKNKTIDLENSAQLTTGPSVLIFVIIVLAVAIIFVYVRNKVTRKNSN